MTTRPTQGIYMDYNATAPVRAEALEVWRRVALECFGNASSTHFAGRAARAVLDEARESLAASLGTRARNVVFTSGGTEGDNLAVRGVAEAAGGGHIVTARTEHPAVLEACRWLAANGFDVTFLEVDATGVVDPDAVRDALREDTILVSVMWVNNETGVIQPVEEIGAVTRERGVPFHCDAVQAVGRIPIDLASVPVDLLSISGHKFGAPKGTGALVVRRGVELSPAMRGGGQEANRRSGTYNVPGAAALAAAARSACAEIEVEHKRLAALRDRLEAGALQRVPAAAVNGAGAARVANTSNIRFDGADGEAVLLALDGHGIAASSASACAASHAEPSYVLMAMGLAQQQAKDSMRFSLGRSSSLEHVDYLLEILPSVIEHIRSLKQTP